jgi:hypothetical protein
MQQCSSGGRNEGCGWAIKLPYVTNKRVFFANDMLQSIAYISNFFDSHGHNCLIYPYVMIQPRMS